MNETTPSGSKFSADASDDSFSKSWSFGHETNFETTGVLPSHATPIIRRINEALKQSGLKIGREFASLLMCSIDDAGPERLIGLLTRGGIDLNDETNDLACKLVEMSLVIKKGMEWWLNKGGGSTPHRKRQENETLQPSATPKSETSTSVSESQRSSKLRNRTATDKARKRDGNRCLITGMVPNTQVCHIIAYSIARSEQDKKIDFWKFLELFLEPAEYTEIYNYIMLPSVDTKNVTSINRLENLLTLDPNVHTTFSDGIITFKPLIQLDEDWSKKYQIKVNFMERRKPSAEFPHEPQLHQLPDKLPEKLPIKEQTDIMLELVLYDVRRKKEISDGDVFTLQTEDPMKLPLPNPSYYCCIRVYPV